ncbi:MAG: lysophospholipid acyltransferase family protein [Holosporales bacterium]|jgi:lysophospholipid acyltransferase (LPLAT)-like uncharacterized protein|nr:lysophospholipid acyltransferase family protein [Holosporales bacterium]
MTFKEFLLKGSVARLLFWWIRLTFASGHWSVIGREIPERYQREGRPFIVCLWHNRIIMAPCAWIWTQPLCALTSLHPDASLVSSVLGYFGINVVRGSSTRGGAAALREMIRLLKAGICVCLTPDGPRGPLYKVQSGTEVLARLAKADIIPLTYSARRYKTLHSWDALRVAIPFTSGMLVWGEPIPYALLKDLSPEQARKTIETRLCAFSEEIDARSCPL